MHKDFFFIIIIITYQANNQWKTESYEHSHI